MSEHSCFDLSPHTHDVFNLTSMGAAKGDEVMTTLAGKDQRKLLYAAQRLFSIKSLLIPESISEIPRKLYFQRELRPIGNRSIFLTDSGFEHFYTVVDVIDRSNFLGGMAEFSDIWKAWRIVVETWLSNGVKPKCADEVVQAIADLVAQEIDDHTFIVPLFGVELEGVDSFALGAMSILRMSVDVLNSAGIKHDRADLPHLLELNKHNLWLRSTMRGTSNVAQQKFS